MSLKLNLRSPEIRLMVLLVLDMWFESVTTEIYKQFRPSAIVSIP